MVASGGGNCEGTEATVTGKATYGMVSDSKMISVMGGWNSLHV